MKRAIYMNVISWLAVAICLTVMSGQVAAQTITISPKTGNVIAAESTGQENHMAGYGGAWVHNQLPLNMFTSDNSVLTDEGLPYIHANNISPKGDKFVWCGGTTNDGFFTISLPKGYRFTGYKMTITNNVSKSDFTVSFGSDNYSMSETSGSFDGTVVASVDLGKHNTNSTTEYVLQRTATLTNDMGNILYFRLGHTSGQYAAVYVKLFEISFECDKNFVETVSPATTISTGVDCVEIPFGTKRIDIGDINWKTVKNNSAWRYNYNDIKDLSANLMLYNDDAVKKGSASTSNVGQGNIKSAGDGTHFALKNDVYYIETPTEATTQNNKSIPVGYRITGCRLHYANSFDQELVLGGNFYITDGSGKFLNTNLQFTEEKVLWSSTTDGYVYNGNTYLKVNSSGWPLNQTYSLSTMQGTGSQWNRPTTFVIDGNYIYYSTGRSNYYISVNGTSGTVSTSGTKAMLKTEQEVSANNNSYTLNLYGTDGNTVAKTVNVSSENPNGELEVVLLNNDAVKFEVTDLTGDAAYVYAELTMEALNPYIYKTDVVATTADGTETLAQSYLADDFTIGDNGQINFNVPDNFASEKVGISFDNLSNKRADDTYDYLKSDGYSRHHYVKSDYYDVIGEQLQQHRNEAANYDFQKKVKTVVAGNQMFQVNNSSDFSVDKSGSTGTTVAYEEHRYSNAAYQQQGGTWEKVELSKSDNKDCYLVTCDETRYNLAPTTTPRHAYYAYYNTNVKLVVQDYEPALKYVKVYNSAMLQSGFDDNAYYGVEVGARMKDSQETVADGTGYLFAQQIVKQINEDAGTTNCPKDASHVLYVDASKLNAVLYGQSDNWGKIEDLQNAIGKNAMIYLPVGTTYALDNVSTKTTSGDFKAENNIILTDKLPFFAPYDIRVDAHNYTEYTRQVTYNYGKSNYVTLVLPYTIDLTEQDGQKGVHTNFQGGSSFQFYNMQLTNAISDVTGKDDYNYQVTGHFSPVEGMATESNKPYLVYILSPEENADENTNIVVRQNGANIMKTPTDDQGLGNLIDGEAATGKIGSSNVTFTPHGTLNGVQLDGNSSTYFYFAKNKFVSSANLPANDKAVYIMPFRTYYDYTGTQNAKYMSISLEPNGDATGIDSPAATVNTGCRIIAGDGAITVIATENGKQAVRNMSGQTIADLQMKAGESRRVSLPAGIYLVGSQKVLVR